MFVHTCPHFRSVDKCGHVCSRATSRIQSSEILDCTVLKTNISAFRKVLRHQNRFTSQRERSKNVRFIGFWSKSTLGSQIRLISMISSRPPLKGQIPWIPELTFFWKKITENFSALVCGPETAVAVLSCGRQFWILTSFNPSGKILILRASATW